MKHRCMSCMEEYDSKYKACPHCGYERKTKVAEPHHIQPETILNKKYIIGKVLEFSGFGATYIAWDATFKHKVAIKEYLPLEFATRTPGNTQVSIYEGKSYALFTSGLESFIREAQLLAELNSDTTEKIYDTFTENNTAYIVTEYLEGVTIAEKIRKNGPVPFDEAVNIITPVLTALAGVHNIGIIHRDISPDNIFITEDGVVKLLDFGSARYATAYNSKGLSDILKKGYAPPEQYMINGEQGTWTDNYAVAATMYKMITGTTPVESVDRHENPLAAPSDMGVEIPQVFENALMKALELNPKDRPQTAEEFLNSITSETSNAAKEQPEDKAKFPLWLGILCALAVILAVVIGALSATGTMQFSNGRIIFPNAPVEEGFVRVPDVLGKSEKEAEALLREKGLKMLITGKKEYEDVESGLVCEQSPEVGDKTKEKNTVEVAISTGPGLGIVPDTLFFTKEAAVRNLREEGFEVEIEEEFHDEVGKGGVIRQSEKENAKVSQNKEIILTVSKGPEDVKTEGGQVVIGNLTGKDFIKTRKELHQKGVYLLIEDTKYSDKFAEDRIMLQAVTKGSKVAEGDVVRVTISLGKEKVRIPDLQYMTKQKATKILEDLGFEVDYKGSKFLNVEDGLVTAQELPEGAQVNKGGKFILTVNNYVEETQVTETSPATTAVTTTVATTTATTTTTELKPTYSGRIIDASNDNGVSGVIINVRKGLNQKTGSSVATTKSGMDGAYSLELDKGNYTFEVIKIGYSTTFINVTADSHSGNDVSMSKTVGGSSARVVLTWDNAPDDLDLQLEYDADGQDMNLNTHNSGKNVWQKVSGKNFAMLENDSTKPGTETIKINDSFSSSYIVSVRNYLETPAISNSNAKVEIYQGDKLVRTFRAPKGGGRIWEVCVINGNSIYPINTIK